MAKQSTDLIVEFNNHIQSIETTRLKMESLLNQGVIQQNEIEQVYSGLFLDVFTYFEGLLEGLFFGLITGDIVHQSANVSSRIPIVCGPIAKEIFFVERSYLEWLPFEKTVKRAKSLLTNGEPFVLVGSDSRNNLQQFLLIRNALAHKSEYAKTKFEQDVIGNSPLTPQEKTPTGFLRSKFRVNPPMTQYELVLSELTSIVQILCT